MQDMEYSSLQGKRIAFALTGSFCTLASAVQAMQALRAAGAELLPVLSFHVRDMDSRFGTAAFWRERIMEAAGHGRVIDTIEAAEPIGPQKMADLLVIAPLTGNSTAKLALGITDTPVLMAAKSHLRNQRPVVLAVSSNDGLSGSAKNIGLLLNTRNIYFVPFGQDDPQRKPNSLVADMSKLPETVAAALAGKQLQPLLL